MRRAGRGGKLVEDAVGQEAELDAVEHAGEAVDHAGQPGDDLRELVQSAAAAELFGVMSDRLEAQDAFAFGVGLQGQVSEVDLEDREVPPRFLDHDCLSRGEVVAGAVRAAFAAEQRAHHRDVEPGSGAVDQRVEQAVHHRSGGEHQVAAVLDLVDRVVVAKAALLLLIAA